MSAVTTTTTSATTEDLDIEYVDYHDEAMLAEIHRLVSKDLSEPYSIFTYRYFLHNWPKMCLCVFAKDSTSATRGPMIATLVCKADLENEVMQGYIAMLAVDQAYRNRGIASRLVLKGIERMIEAGCKEIVLETEVSNKGAIGLYTKLGFVKEERMTKYYLNGGDAYRLKLAIDLQPPQPASN